jgi:lipopolysaccharide transport system ATP-binding protein
MADIAIRAEGLAKRYSIGTQVNQYGRLTESMWNGITAPIRKLRGLGAVEESAPSAEEFWALRDVSFELGKGEVLGVIGRNGAGKTTLLKLLSRITEPTAGRARLNGRVGALLEVGTGFHPELTGRENVFLNGGILGMRRAEIKQKFDEIVEFAEVERFIDTPVKRYSSGMFVRLAFAVAAHLEPEILIIDEVLAVGDLAFQKKCLGRMNAVAGEGRTVLFVSHNMGAVKSLCPRSILLEGGHIVFDGPTGGAIGEYVARLYNQSGSHIRLEPRPEVPVQVLEIWCENETGEEVPEVELGTDLLVRARYEIRERVRDVTFALLVSNEGSPLLFSHDTDTDADGSLRDIREPGIYDVRIRVPFSILKEGSYTLAIQVGYGQVNLTDDDAFVVMSVVNNERDLTHRGYRSDRPGFLFRELEWQTEASVRA